LLSYFSPKKVPTTLVVAALSTSLPAITKRFRDGAVTGEDTMSPDKRIRANESAGAITDSSESSIARAPTNANEPEPAALSNQVPPVNVTPPSPMTEAQLARIEENRLAALEKRRQSEEKKKAAEDFNLITFADLERLFVCESWRRLLQTEFGKPYFAALKHFLVQEQAANMTVFPPLQKIFHAFDVCPVENVKVVIIGQDPYHDSGQAEGLCFSVPRGQAIPSSLQNIYKELGDCIPDFKRPNHGHLGAWGAQGVFLLNTGLTVRAHEANSHNGKGWQTFTDAVIAQLSSQREGLVFFLWGKHAQEKERLVNKTKRHFILKCAHPSGLSAARGFFGSRHFAQANEALIKRGVTPINWQV